MHAIADTIAFSLRPTGSTDLDPAGFTHRAKSFGSVLRQLPWAAIIAQVRQDGSVATHLIAPPGRGGRAAGTVKNLATNLAATLNCALEPADVPQLPVDGPIVTARVRHEAIASRDNAAGADPTELAKVVARNGAPDSWVAVVMRGPSRREEVSLRRWISGRGGTDSHYSRGGELIATSVYCCGPDMGSARDLLVQLVAAMPGLDVNCDAVPVGSGSLPWAFGAASAAAYAVSLTVDFSSTLPQVQPWMMLGGSSAAAVLAHGALGRTPRSKLISGVESGTWPKPRHRAVNPPRPPKARPDGTVPTPKDPPYPLHPNTLLLAPHMVVGLAAPVGGALSGERTVTNRPTPPAMREPIGPLLGYDLDGKPCHLSADDLFAGIAAFGQPGYGKSFFTHILLAFACAERVSPSGRAGFPGRQSGIVSFEAKGDGATESIRAARAMGDDPLLIDLADPSTPMIDLFSFPGTLDEKATRWIEMARYAFGSDSMQYQSFETLQSVIPAAIYLSHQPDVNQHPLVLIYQLLCGGGNDERGVELAARVKRAAALSASTNSDPDAIAAAQGLDILYGASINPSARRQRCDAPRNKLDALVKIAGAWERGRAIVSWDDIVSHHDAVVINLGVGVNGVQVSAEQTRLTSSMMLFGLRETIARLCSGWQHQGRSTTIIADELSDLAGTSPEVVSWLREKGRSYGVRPVFATQFLSQLPEVVRQSVVGFGNVAWFTPATLPGARDAVDDMVMSDSTWDIPTIAALPKYHAAIRATVDGRRQTPAIIRVGDWERHDWEGFRAAQGLAHGEPISTDRPWIRVPKTAGAVDSGDAATIETATVDLSKTSGHAEPETGPENGTTRFDPTRFGAPFNPTSADNPVDNNDW